MQVSSSRAVRTKIACLTTLLQIVLMLTSHALLNHTFWRLLQIVPYSLCSITHFGVPYYSATDSPSAHVTRFAQSHTLFTCLFAPVLPTVSTRLWALALEGMYVCTYRRERC